MVIIQYLFSTNGSIFRRLLSSTSVIRKTLLHILLISAILCGNRSSCRIDEFQSSVSSAYLNTSTIDLNSESPAISLKSLFISSNSLQTSPTVPKLSIIPTASKSVVIQSEENLSALPELQDTVSPGFTESTISCSDQSTRQSALEVDLKLADDQTILTEAVQTSSLVTADITPSQEESSTSIVEAGIGATTNDTLSLPVEPATHTAEIDNKITTPDTEDMPSFDEWKKKKQAELGDGEKAPLGAHQYSAVVGSSGSTTGGPANPSSASGKKVIASQKRRRNYASYECGAKVVASNKESEGSGRILNEQMDEYMLNPCEAKIWFVIELCDTIQVSQLELANFELFSSLPKEFTVSASDQYPTRDWTPLGTFTAQDQRVLHTFPLMQQGYGKFLMVEFQGHYGKEHYCPLSVVRVFGTSMVDEFENLESTEHASTSADEEDGPVIPSTMQAEAPNDIFGNAKKVMMKFINKAAQVLGREDVALPSGEVTAPDSNLSVKSTHKSTMYTGHALSDDDELLNCPNHSLGDLHQIALLCGFCFSSSAVLQSYKCRFMQTVLNISGIDQLCLSATCQCDPQVLINDTQKDSILKESVSSSNAEDSVASASESTKFSSSSYTGTVQLDSSQESLESVESTTNASHSPLHVKTESLPSVTLTYFDASSVSSEQTETVSHPSLIEPLASATNIMSSPVSVDVYPESTLPVDMPNDTVMDVPVLADDESRGGSRTEAMGVPVSSTQKESVFVRLNNRIRQLEVNLSLSSQYLQELSQRYRKQMEDMQKAFNRTVEALNQTAVLADERDQQQQTSLAALQRQMEHVTGLAQWLKHRNKTLYREVLETHLFIIAVEAIIVITVLTLCWRRYRLNDQNCSAPVADQTLPNFWDENPLFLGATRTPLKRHHSVCDLPVTLIGTKKRRPSESVSKAGSYSDLMIVEPAIPIYIEQPHKARKRHRNRKNKSSFPHSISNPNLSCISEVTDSTKLPHQHSPITSETAGVLFFPSSSQEGSENCENCSPTKTEDTGSHTKVPFQNLTNTKVNKDKSGACKEHFSLSKPLKISEKKGAV